MARWVVGWLLVAALGLLAARLAVQPERDAWLFLGASREGSFVVARYDVANTGLFAEQLTTRLAVLRDAGSPLAHRTISGPARIDGDGVHGALDTMSHTGGTWEWNMVGESLSAIARTDAEASCPPRVGTFTAIVDLADEGGRRGDGQTLVGRAILARTHAVGNVSGGALYALNGEDALGLDPLAECPGFFIQGAESVTVELPWIPPGPERAFSLAVAGHHIDVRLEQRPFREGTLDHALLAERWLAWVVGFRSPSIALQRVRVRVDGSPAWGGVLILRDHHRPS
jgi:hypothetical protein